MAGEDHDRIKNIRSTVVEKNGIMFLDSITSVGTKQNIHTCILMKDNVQYSFILVYISHASEKEYIYDLIENAEFD